MLTSVEALQARQQIASPRDGLPVTVEAPSADATQFCIQDLFSAQAALYPEREALVFGEGKLTYRELDSRSNQLAWFLFAEGIREADHVAVFMERSSDLIVAILAILKAGATYLPIDVEYPADRVRFLVNDAQVKLVLTQQKKHHIFNDLVASVSIDTPGSPIYSFSSDAVRHCATPESIALLSYTSGSTGLPKAARISHRAIIRCLRNTNYIEITNNDRVAQSGSPSFDAAILEIWLPLANGATLVGICKEALLNPRELAAVIQRDRISVLLLNTAYVHQIGRDAPQALRGVRKVIFGGEAAEAEPLAAILREVGPGVLLNSYGPAEACVITSYCEIREIPAGATSVPIGRPVTNAQVYLLDSRLQPVPVGESGEIYIGGQGVASGYFNRPTLTAQRFLPDPFCGNANQLLYRTGDFARMREDGDIDFIGRIDEQVKIRGHRIELGEVRQALTSHPALQQIFLMVREDVPGDRRLVAYVTLRKGSQATSIHDSLRQHAAASLPAEMVPAAFVVLDSIPLNIQGKIDRQSLPQPSIRPNLDTTFHTPETGLEQKLAGIWQDLLRIDKIGANDSFFDLGGHSLLAARLIARMERQLGINIPLATLFEAPTIAQLALRLRRQSFEQSWAPLVELSLPQEPSTAIPFFCVHSLGANLVSLHKIAKLMGGKRAVYGLQPHGLDGVRKPFTSIEEIASAYIEEIRLKQPKGPYFLGGVCLGGVIAFEVAQQLEAAGELVSLVILIDSYAPGKYRYLSSRSALSEYLDRHLGDILVLPYLARVAYLAKWFSNGFVRLGRAFGFGERSSIAVATRAVRQAHYQAFRAYKPKPYVGRVLQLMCGEASHRSYEDRRLAWSTVATRGLEVRLMPGNHHTMIEEPHARVLAHELARCLGDAERQIALETRRGQL